MEKIEVNWLKSSGSYIAQVYSAGLEFCFLSDDMKQCHNFVFCKDFLQDALHGQLNNRKASIYGFSYDPSTKPHICMKRTRIALTNRSDNNFRERIPNMIDFINQFSRELKLKKTYVFEALDPPRRYSKCGIFVTDGSPRWLNSPPMISMYSLMIRCGFAHTVGNKFMDTIDGLISGKIKPYQNSDSVQVKGAIDGIKKILKIGYRKFFYIENSKNYPSKANTSTMHSSCGIMGFTSGTSKSIVPYWHRKSI